MASQWLCKVLGQEIGPVGFPDLVEMIRSGTLKEDDPVRREGESGWTRARDVIGLLRAAQKQKAEPVSSQKKAQPVPSKKRAQPVPSKKRAQPERLLASAAAGPKEPTATKPRRIRRQRVFTAGGIVLAVLVLTALVSQWRSQRNTRFPEPGSARIGVQSASRAEAGSPPHESGFGSRLPGEAIGARSPHSGAPPSSLGVTGRFRQVLDRWAIEAPGGGWLSGRGGAP